MTVPQPPAGLARSPHVIPARRAMVEVDVIVVGCAVSAGAHAALVPAHLREAVPLGSGFIVAVALLLAVGAALVLQPGSVWSAPAAVPLLAALIAAFAASRTIGIPLLAPEPEPVDAVGLATKL